MKTSKVNCPALIVAALILFSFTPQKQEGIQFFTGTLKEALAKAKVENKIVFLDAYAEWCGPCKYMDKTVFTDKALGAYMNLHFVSLHIDMEKGDGPALADKLPSINGYPSLLFIGSNGLPIKTICGSRNTADFSAEARLVVLSEGQK